MKMEIEDEETVLRRSTAFFKLRHPFILDTVFALAA